MESIDTSFGPQQRSMLEEISYILTQYPDGSNILKELIQNADDACAGNIVFLLDTTQHPTGNLASPDLSASQGPALYSWNDSIFTEKDWEGIQKIGRSVKERTVLKVGRFGLGFVSVYHLTDTPIIFSDKRLGINHPLWELVKPNSRGMSIPIEKLVTDASLSDHLSCFKGYFGYQGESEYNGTIFRFPLRRETSVISARVSDITGVRDRLLLPLMEEAEYALLFLKSLSSIEIRERVGNDMQSLFRAEIPLNYQNIVKKYRQDITEFVSSREFLTHTNLFVCLFPTISFGADSEKREKVWLVLNLIGFGAPNGDLIRFYREQDLNYLPWVGLGLATGIRDLSKCGCWCFEWEEENPSVLFNSIKHAFSNPFIVDPETELVTSTGRLFCFLPTQLDSNFPFHIHGYFSLSSNRRSIDWPASDNENDIGAKWNILMTQNLSSIAYAALLYISFIALKHPSPLSYHYQLLSRWSPHECSIFSSILCGGLRRLSHHLLLFSHQDGGKWLPINDAIFLPSLVNETLSHEDVCLKLFQLLEQPIIDVPPFIGEIILNIPDINSQVKERILTPVNIRDLLVDFSVSFPCMEYLASDNVCIALLDVLLAYVSTLESDLPFLEGVPLLPTAGSNQPRLFTYNGDTEYYISDDTATHLTIFPGLGNSFVNPSLPTQLHSILHSLARDTSLNLFDLTNLENRPDLFSQLLTKSLSCEFPTETVVKWHPGVANHPPVNWITQLYHFIGSSQSLLSAVSHLPILPQHSTSSDVITLLPLRSQSVYVEIGIDPNLQWLESILEYSGCLMCEKQSFIECFRDFVLPPIPVGLIQALHSTQILNNFIPKFQDPQITDEMKYSFIDLLIPYVDECNSHIVKQLPVFPNTRGGWLTLHSDIILPPPNIPLGILYPSHFISPFKSSISILCERLSIRTISTECFCTYHVMPFLVSLENCDARDKLTVFVLENIPRLNFEICEVGKCLKNTEWITDASPHCCLHTPSRLLDPRDSLLKSLLPQTRSLFPSDICQNHFDIMKRFLDMKSHDTLTLELLVKVCQYSVETLKSKTGSEWQNTFHVLLDLLSNYLHSFDSLSWRGLFEVFETPFMFPDVSPPNDWPHSIRFHTSSQLCCPRDVVLCHPNDLFLIGSVFYTFSDSFYNPSIQQILTEMGTSPLSPQLVIRQLNYISQTEINNADGEKVYRMISKIYNYFNCNVFPLNELESSIVFIPGECKFVSKEIIVFDAPFDLTPYLYSLRQLRYESTQFFQILAIKQSPSSEQLSLILCKMTELGSLLSENQLRIVIDILKYFVEQDLMVTYLQIYIPGKDLRLYAPRDEKLVFWDHRWLDRNLIEEDFVLVHDSISNDLAYKLGVSPFSERVAPPSEDFWCEESGQQVCVTDRLRSILEAYSGNINVLKEMLQNADDAKATEMKIVFDWRNHPTQTLLSAELKDWQGPAILFYNDSEFSDKDFENIMKIDGATKAEDATTIGRYGLGFCTVYHFTDVPSFVSRNYVHILDPQKKYISKSKGGRKIEFCNGEYVRYIRLYKDQFVPYEGIFGCDILNHHKFNGTLFRVPLRSSDISSDISLVKFNHSEMINLQDSFLREAEGLLFFTQHVTSISIYNIRDTSQDTELIHMVRKDEICQSPATEPFLQTNKSLVKLLYEGQPVRPVVSCCPCELTVTNKMAMNWIVIYATGGEACVDVIRGFPSAAVAPLPFAGVAMNLDLLQQVGESDFQSTLYCFFPLPIPTSFPFHCHAMFELRQDRQGLVDSVEAKTEWNKVLVSDALVLATLTLYQHLAERAKLSNDEISRNAYIRILYKMFSENILSDPLWKGFTSAISKQFSQSECKIFPVTTESGIDWGNFCSTYFLNLLSFKSDLRELFSHSFSTTVLNVVVSCGYSIAIIPDSISESSALLSLLFEIGTDNIIDLKMFTHIFFANLSKIEIRMIVYVLSVLISACTPHIWLREAIKSIQCIPCGDTGSLLFPYEVIDPNNRMIAQLFEKRENRLPSEACIDSLFTSGPVLDNLRNYLGLITSKLSPEELKGRTEYINANRNRELAVRLIEYLDQMIFTGSEVEVMRSVMGNAPFIPVECPIIAETFSFILKFFSPSEVIPFCMKSIGELHLPVCPENILRYQDFISTFMLYNGNNLPRPINLIAIEELKLCISHYDSLVHEMDLPDKVTRIYETIGEHCPADGYSEVPNNGILIPSVGFCDRSRLLLDSNEDFPPYIFSLNSYYSRRSKYVNEFFEKMNVNETLSHLQCMMVIEELYGTHLGNPLAPFDQQIVLKFLYKISESHTRDNKFLLGKDDIIHLVQDCVFSDLSWENRSDRQSFTQRDRIYYFIHTHISNEVAFELGARPLSHVKLSGRTALPFRYESRGQSEPLTRRLRSILSEYESSVDVFKELTQNADDARATEIKFLFDYSHHGEERVIHPEMRHWQGPAIYCYNNATFSEADFENITRLAGRSKMEDQTTIGTYGIGFNTVYHLTDLPSFVSRRLLTFFDPQVLYLQGLIHPGSPGMQIDFIDEWDSLEGFSDQLSVYNGIFGCDLSSNTEFDGTLFRLPLRTTNIDSEISRRKYTPEIFLTELHAKLLGMAKELIMFLQNLSSIELYTRSNLDEGIVLTYRVTKSPPPTSFISVNRQRFDDLLGGASCDPITDVSTFTITTHSPPLPNEHSEEFLFSCSSGTRLCFDLVNRIKGEYEVCTLPVCSVAMPKCLLNLSIEEFTDFQCYLFCFLPLPCLSNYRMHINASFQLQQSRRALHCTSDGSIKTEWNQSLIADALSIAVVNMLTALTNEFPTANDNMLTDLQLERYYSIWPDSIQDDILWGNFSLMIAERIMNTNSRIFYCSTHPRRWIAFEEVSIFITDPNIYTLDNEFIAVLFYFASLDQIYFINLQFQLTKQRILSHFNFDESRRYSIDRACKEILFPKLKAIMETDPGTVKLIIYTLLHILKFEPSLKDILTTEACFPCGEESPIFRAIPEVVSPLSLFAQIFYPDDKRLPHSSFANLFDKEIDPEASQELIFLGTITSELPIDLLIDRCHKTLQLAPDLADQHAIHLLEYINTMRPGTPIQNDIRNELQDIQFIPVYQDVIYNAICPELICIYSSPSSCCAFNRRHLSPHYRAVTEEINSLHHAMSLLGISSNMIPLRTALYSIFLIKENIANIEDLDTCHISETFKAIYLYLAEACFSEGTDSSCGANQDLVRNTLSEKNWILGMSYRAFYPVSRTILSQACRHFHSQFINSFPFSHLMGEEYFKRFVEFMKIPNKISPKMAHNIICLMKEHFGDTPLPSTEACDESGFVIHLINIVLKLLEEIPDDSFLLTEFNELKLASSLYLNDTPWIVCSITERATFVHHDITFFSSEKLGAKSRIGSMCNDIPIGYVEFGQHESISNRIETLLREFQFDVTIFKELIQNAEDAKATEVGIVLDCQSYGEESLCLAPRYQKKWKELQQVPSLLIYNDRPFTEADIKGIQEVGIGGKQGKNTIGRFGLGFNSVFHLTRVPCLLTCSEDGSLYNFCVFDPYREHLELPHTALPGLRKEINTHNLENFPHQFSPYFLEPIFRNFTHSMSNLRERKCFSIFRLPLNKIGSGNDVDRAMSLLSDLIKEAPRLLPFISHVKNINIFHIKSDGTTTCEGIISSQIMSQNIVMLEYPITLHNQSIEIITKKVIVNRSVNSFSEFDESAEDPEMLTNEVSWLIYHFNGNVETFCRESDVLLESVDIYNREKLILFSSIAVETVSKEFPAPTQKRYLYCHLPFGTSLNFPVHINCPFILDPHRRYVSYQDEQTGSSSWDSVWHSEILKRVLTPLYCKLLLDLGPGGERHSNLPDAKYFKWYYSLFPVIHGTDCGSNSNEFLQALGREVLKMIYQNNSPILLADDIGITETRTWYLVHGTNAGIFKDIREGNIDCKYKECAKCLVKLDYHFTFAPLSLANSFNACELTCTFFRPLEVLEYINTNRDKLAKVPYPFPCSLQNCVLTFSELSIILKFILKLGEESSGCIPLKVDYEYNLGIFICSENDCFTIEYVRLLPHLKACFLCEQYSLDIIKLLLEHRYVENLNANFLAHNLQVTACVTPEFFLLFWTFIVKNGSKGIVSLFDSYKLIPVVFNQENISFLAIRTLDSVATGNIDLNYKSILQKLECPFLCLTSFDIVNPPTAISSFSSIKELIESLAINSWNAMCIIECIRICKNIDVVLSEQDACSLRNLFQGLSFYRFSYWGTLLRLKIFIAHSGPRPTDTALSALSGFKVFLYYSNNFPLIKDLIQRLNQSFDILFLSNSLNPDNIIRAITEHSTVHLVDVEELINSYILNTAIFPQLESSLQILLIRFFNSLTPRIDWMDKLIDLKFIQTDHGLCRPSELFCPKVLLFVIYRNELLLPECWTSSEDIYQIIKRSGLIINVSLDIILESAKDVAHSSSTDSQLTKLTIDALKVYASNHYKGNATEDSILRQLAFIPFLPLFEVTTLISSNQESGRVYRLGRFSEAQLHKHHDYCCTTCLIFDPIVCFRNERVMELLGLKANPPIGSVKMHLGKLMEKCRQFSNEEINTYLKELFLHTYGYLQDTLDPLHEFQNAECILYDCKLYRPINVVMNWRFHLSPYLFQCPIMLNPYREFLYKLGVSERPSYKHFKSVLISIRRDNGSDQLTDATHDHNVLFVLALSAFNFLIEELRAMGGEVVELDGMLLLTNRHEFIQCGSPNLFYADDTQLLNKVSEVFPDIRILASLNYDKFGSSAPPPSLKLKYLSKVFTQTLCSNVYNNCVMSDEQAEIFQTRLRSPEVYSSLRRIYFHQTSQEINKLKFRDEVFYYDTEENQHSIMEGYSTFKDKIEKLRIISVSSIEVVISDTRVPDTNQQMVNTSYMSFLDKSQGNILINTAPSFRERLPVEITYDLNQYFCNLFERSLFHLLICLVYTGEEIDIALNNFKVKQLPPDLVGVFF